MTSQFERQLKLQHEKHLEQQKLDEEFKVLAKRALDLLESYNENEVTVTVSNIKYIIRQNGLSVLVSEADDSGISLSSTMRNFVLRMSLAE